MNYCLLQFRIFTIIVNDIYTLWQDIRYLELNLNNNKKKFFMLI